MTDIREGILARLVEVVATVPNLRTVRRNDTDYFSALMPAAFVLDGDEDVVAGNDGSRPSNRPMLVEMAPEIHIIEQSDAIGSDLTAFRRELMKLVLADATLNSLTGSNGAIQYLGCDSSFGWLEKQYGGLQIRFRFKYPLKPDDF